MEWKLHPVSHENEPSEKNAALDATMDEISALLQDVGNKSKKPQETSPEQDKAEKASRSRAAASPEDIESEPAAETPEAPEAPQPAAPVKPTVGFPTSAAPSAMPVDGAKPPRMKVVRAPRKKRSDASYKASVVNMKKKGAWQSNIFALAGVLMAICSVVAIVLALINANTKDIIQKYEEETRAAALEAIFPDADDFVDVTDVLSNSGNSGSVLAVYKAYEGDNLLGYCVDLETNGFNNSTPIELMVGSDPMNKITSLSVVSHSETPGIGAAVLEKNPEFMAQFADCGRPVSFTPQMPAVSGATVTSNAVLSGLNDALWAVDMVRVAEADALGGGGNNG